MLQKTLKSLKQFPKTTLGISLGVVVVASSLTISTPAVLNNAKAAPGDLTVSNISPSSGPQTGGTQVVIDGTGFMKTVTWKQVSAGGSHTCAIASDNQAYC